MLDFFWKPQTTNLMGLCWDFSGNHKPQTWWVWTHIYPVRCAHNPAPCHFFEPSGETWEAFRPPNGQWFWKPGDQFWGPGSYFGVLDTYFQDFWDDCMLLSKKVSSRTPPKAHSNPFFTVLCFFFCVLHVVDFSDFQCPEIPFWLPFSSISGSPGLLQKQLKVCNYRSF